MNAALAFGIVLAAWAAITALVAKPTRQENESVWASYLDNSEGVARSLGRAARPLARSGIVRRAEATEAFEFLQNRLRLSLAFATSTEVFFSIQLLTMLVSGALLSVVLLAELPTFVKFVMVALAAILPAWPYNEVSQKALKRGNRITMELPDFAELLVMVLPTMSVPQALAFTTDNAEGLVADELRELVKTLASRAMSEDEAFSLTSQRLGTPEGRQFVDALRDAYIEGTKVVESINSQAESMRKIAYQNQRAAAKKLPTKLTFIFALHFMTLMFALTLLPVVYGLGKALQ